MDYKTVVKCHLVGLVVVRE